MSFPSDKDTAQTTYGACGMLVKLFMLWNNRLEHEKLMRDKEKIEQQLGKKQQRRIKPIGTNA